MNLLSPQPIRAGWLGLALFLSGAAALGYEIVWTRLLALVLGHETLGVLAGLAAFFAGLALGAWIVHGHLRRIARPAALFARLEVIAAAWAAISPALLTWCAHHLPASVGLGQVMIGFVIAAVVLLPATLCMGAGFPLLVEAIRRGDQMGRSTARLYAANVAGACVGVLVTVHWLVPAAGIVVASFTLGALGALAGFCAHIWSRRCEPLRVHELTGPSQEQDASLDPDPDLWREPWLLYGVVAATGLLGIGLEVVAVRVLAQRFSGTVYTFADVLAVYLAGTAMGAGLFSSVPRRWVARRPARVLGALLWVQGLSVVASAAIARGVPGFLLDPVNADPFSRLLSEAWIAAAVLALPTIVMGAVWAHCLSLFSDRGVGRAQALNGLACAAAPAVVGLGLIPALGLTDAWFAVAWGYFGVMAIFCWFRRFSSRWQLVCAALMLVATAMAGARPSAKGEPSRTTGVLSMIEPMPGWKVVERDETELGVVLVSESASAGQRVRRLQVDQDFRMGGALGIGERRMGHLAMLLAPERSRVLFLGVGTGATAGAALLHEDVKRIDAVELLPGVLHMLHWFEDQNGGLEGADRVSLHAADARRFVAASDESWDVIVADLFHPGRDGAAVLYALEHYRAIRQRLSPQGTFLQWLPLYQLDPDSLDILIRTFLAEFDGEVHSFLALYNAQTPAIGLISRAPGASTIEIDLEQLAARMQRPEFVELALVDPYDFLGGYMLDRNALVELVGDGPIERDLSPRVSFSIPLVPVNGVGNLERILKHRVPLPITMLKQGAPERVRVESFSRAIAHYLEGEIALQRAIEAGLGPAPQASIDAWEAAAKTEPDFLPVRNRLRQVRP